MENQEERLLTQDKKEIGVSSKKRMDRSYGLLVFRIVPRKDGPNEVQYLIVRPSCGDIGKKNPNPYYLPKGRQRDGESPQETALREVYEETGIRAKIISPLGLVKYRGGNKEVGIYLAQFTGGNVCDDGRCLQHDWENDDVRFVSEKDARRMLRHEFVEMIDIASKLFRRK